MECANLVLGTSFTPRDASDVAITSGAISSTTVRSLVVDATELPNLRQAAIEAGSPSTLTDVTDGSLSFTGDGISGTIGYSSLSVNGTNITLSGDITGGAAGPFTTTALNQYNAGSSQLTFRDGQIGAGETANANFGNAVTGDINLGTNSHWVFTQGDVTIGQEIEDIVGATTIATASQFVSVTPFVARFTSGGVTLEFTVSSVSRNTTGRLNAGTNNQFYFGGTAANNFNLTAADVTSDGGTFNLVNGSAISFEIGAAATQTIGDLTITNGVGNWTGNGTVEVCNDNGGGSITTGGDLMVGGDLGVGSLSFNTIPFVDADGMFADSPFTIDTSVDPDCVRINAGQLKIGTGTNTISDDQIVITHPMNSSNQVNISTGNGSTVLPTVAVTDGTDTTTVALTGVSNNNDNFLISKYWR